MSSHHSRRTAFVAMLALIMGVVLAGPADGRPGHRVNPVIFVHGFAGSGAQFESQQLRLTANGYPSRFIRVLEYDSTFSQQSMADVHAALDRLVAEVREQTRAARVDVLGHSLGTTVMHGYLNSSPERAANVAHYVNIDGRTAAAPPGGVPTLAIWAGRGALGRSIEGAVNVTIPNQTHVEVATSAESFVEIYRFLTGRRPATSQVVPERDHWVAVSGRAVNFPINTGVTGATLQIWRVSGHTGQRVRRHAVAIRPLGGDGSWGPVRLERGEHHEFAIVRGDGSATHHFYFEPFVRSDHLVRLLTSPPGTGLDALVERSERHVSLVVSRNKELWGDQGAESDVLRVNGTNIVNPATAPIGKLVIGMFAFDRGSDGVTDTSVPIPAFFATPFISGVDVFMPAARPSTGRVSVALTSRGAGPTRTVNFPNFPSTTDRVTVQFNDFEPARR
jgi:pimeloyl-ACP methyl ester carboxylesterase